MAIEIRCPESTATGETLFMALELGSTTWKVAFATTRGMRPRVRTISARALSQLRAEIGIAKTRLGLCADAPVRSCTRPAATAFGSTGRSLLRGLRTSSLDSEQRVSIAITPPWLLCFTNLVRSITIAARSASPPT
jgi:hypothetical protein